VGALHSGYIENAEATVDLFIELREPADFVFTSTGGLVGISDHSVITLSEAYGRVWGYRSVGGFIGTAWKSTILDSYSYDADVSVENFFGGGFVGLLIDSTVENSHAYKNVKAGKPEVGGFVGSFDGQSIIRNSSANGSVSAHTFHQEDNDHRIFGGFVGSINTLWGGYREGIEPLIENSYATGQVYSKTLAGGFFGYAESSNNITINRCYATGRVLSTISSAHFLGGFGGAIDKGIIKESFALGEVRPNSQARSLFIGGFIGGIGIDDLEGVEIENSYAQGKVRGDDYVGGFIGYIDWDTFGEDANEEGDLIITNAYSTGEVTAEENRVGGFIALGHEDVLIYDSFWDTLTSGQDSSDGGEGRTTSELQDETAYPGTWEFGTIWDILGENQYPILLENLP